MYAICINLSVYFVFLQKCMEVLNQTTLQAHAPPSSNTFKNSQHGCGKQTHKFTFSSIFPDKTSQSDFFENTVKKKVKNFIEGQNCLIFTYGVTNSGKTYTIQGIYFLYSNEHNLF